MTDGQGRIRQHGKLGALPRDMSRPAPRLADYLLSADPLPRSPLVVDRASKVSSWPMYLNDQIGDCTIAGMFHALASMAAYSGNFPGGVTFSDSEVIKAYSAVSGYDPVTGANDNGASLQSVCQYMVQHGAVDTQGHLHKLAAWAEIDNYTDLRLLKRVANAFGSVYLAINCPLSAQQQFGYGLPWTYIPGSPIEGGHCIDLQWSAVGTDALDDEAIITWGAEQRMNVAFAEHYLCEAVAIVSADDVNVQTGRNPVGMNLSAMVADCQSKYLV